MTVQKKTFTKWSVIFEKDENSALKRRNLIGSRLNSKVSPRNVMVNDLVTDLSDGVFSLSLPPSLYSATV